MAIDLSPHHIDPGDDTELPTKLNNMMDAVETGVNQGLSDIDDNLDTLSDQITSELGDAVDTVEAVGETAVTAAATATTQANNASNSATASANSAATAVEITNITQVQTFTNPLARAVRVAMSGASSGSRGWLVQDNPEINFGTGDFTLHWEGSLPDWTPGSVVHLFIKYQDNNNQFGCYINTDGTLRLFAIVGGVAVISGSGASSTLPVTSVLSNDQAAKIGITVTRETALSAGSIRYNVNGHQLGSAVSISAAETVSINNTGAMYISGTASVRSESQTTAAITYNRAMTAPEILDLAINGPSPADIGAPGNRASQVAMGYDFSSGTDSWTLGNGSSLTGGNSIGGETNLLRFITNTSGGAHRAASPANLTIGHRYRFDGVYYVPSSQTALDGIKFQGGLAASTDKEYSNLLNTTGAATSFSFEFVAESTTLYAVGYDGENYTWTDGGGDDEFYFKGTLTKVGITGLWSAEHAQSDTGQVLDQIHGNHALLPSSGATRIPQNLRPVIESPSAHSWTATNEIQYVAANQALMSADDSFLVIDVESDTAFDLNVGDGSDPDRFVAAHTLSVGKNRLTISNPFNDGTNRKLTVQPASSVTASITVHAEMIKERI